MQLRIRVERPVSQHWARSSIGTLGTLIDWYIGGAHRLVIGRALEVHRDRSLPMVDATVEGDVDAKDQDSQGGESTSSWADGAGLSLVKKYLAGLTSDLSGRL